MKGRPGCLTIYLHTDICLLKLQHWQKLDRNDGEGSRYLRWKPNGSLFSSGFNSEISLIHLVELRQIAFSVGSHTFSQFQRQPAANTSKSGGATTAKEKPRRRARVLQHDVNNCSSHIFTGKRSVLFEMAEYFCRINRPTISVRQIKKSCHPPAGIFFCLGFGSCTVSNSKRTEK